VWLDVNGDAAPAADEPGVAGVTVHLLRDGAAVDQAITDEAGAFRFTDLAPGAYTVAESQPSWLRFSTTPDEVEVSVAHDPAPVIHIGDWNGRPLWLPLLTR
jgi:uncharacterized surface anchored protein